jgi:hypothetical protein
MRKKGLTRLVVHICNLSSGKAKAGGCQGWGWPWLHSEFEASLRYIVRPCLQKQTNKVCTCSEEKMELKNIFDLCLVESADV